MWLLEDEMEQEKIYGLYSAGLDEEKIENFQEWQLYLLIEQYGGMIFWVNHHACDRAWELTPEEHTKISKELDTLQYRIEYLAVKLKRFGVDVGEPTAGKHISKGQNYWTWYEFWNHHFNSLSEEDFKEFNRRLKNNEDITEFLPKTSWNAGLGA